MVVLPLTVPPRLLVDQGLSSLGRARQQPCSARLRRPWMQENFRQFLDRLRQTGELVDLHQPVDIRHIATLVDQAKTALYFQRVICDDMPVLSVLLRSRERAIMSLGCETYRDIEDKLTQAIANPIPPKYVKTSPTREIVMVGDDVDLYKLPIPMSSIYDGGPMITAGTGFSPRPHPRAH